MPAEPDHLLLRRYVALRARGELELSAETWERLTLNNFDRIKQIVKAFRFSAGGPRLAEHEWGSAASEAYLRVVAMGASFQAQEAGRFYAALVTCVQNSCMDYGRKELRHERHAAGSIDKTFEPDGEAGPYDAALAAHDAELRRRAAEAVEEELGRRQSEQLVAWAIGEIQNSNYREVLEMTYLHEFAAEEIAERLGISVDNVYARRSRGVRELERILRDRRP